MVIGRQAARRANTAHKGNLNLSHWSPARSDPTIVMATRSGAAQTCATSRRRQAPLSVVPSADRVLAYPLFPTPDLTRQAGVVLFGGRTRIGTSGHNTHHSVQGCRDTHNGGWRLVHIRLLNARELSRDIRFIRCRKNGPATAAPSAHPGAESGIVKQRTSDAFLDTEGVPQECEQPGGASTDIPLATLPDCRFCVGGRLYVSGDPAIDGPHTRALTVDLKPRAFASSVRPSSCLMHACPSSWQTATLLLGPVTRRSMTGNGRVFARRPKPVPRSPSGPRRLAGVSPIACRMDWVPSRVASDNAEPDSSAIYPSQARDSLRSL